MKHANKNYKILVVLFLFSLSLNVFSKIDAYSFRDIFKASIKRIDGKVLSNEDFNKLVYMFPPVKGQSELGGINQDYNNFMPEDLFNMGSELAQKDINLDSLEQKLKDKKLFFVIVPGIFGEFIDNRAFEEVFRNEESSFSKSWQNALLESDVTDKQNHLKRVDLINGNNEGSKEIPIKELISASSVDNDKGEPLLRAILFKTEAMSLETLGTTKSRAEIFNRRLEKVFKVIGNVPENIVLVGYSRGTPFALEMLSQAKSDEKAWLKNVKGMVSLGGVVFGSDLADDAFDNKDSDEFKMIGAVKEFMGKLKPLTSDSKRKNAATIYKNTKAYLQLAAKMMPREMPKFGPVKGISYDVVKEKLSKWKEAYRFSPDIGSMLRMMVTLYNEFGFKFGRFTKRQYNDDVYRFKRLLAATLEGVYELRTDFRINWWKNNKVPTHVRYYGISATMDSSESGLVHNRIGYNDNSPDQTMLFTNWEGLSKVDLGGEKVGSSINDSQVSVVKTQFWPEVIESLNPDNRISATPLAVFGTHHWGIALPFVNKISAGNIKDGSLLEKNPFPRKALLYSLGLSVASGL